MSQIDKWWFTKTSRPCPPYGIEPISVSKDVETVGELELISYAKDNNTIVIDARPKEWYLLESLPKAINVPEKVTRNKKLKIDFLKYWVQKREIISLTLKMQKD